MMTYEDGAIVVGRVSDRKAFQQKALEIIRQRVGKSKSRVASVILSQAPHLAWKAPETLAA